MKRSAFVELFSALLMTLAVNEGSSQTYGEMIWQIGRLDGQGPAMNGATEYPATGAYWHEFEYTVGSDTDPVNAPTCPGYLHTVNVCNVDPGRPCTDTTRRLIIRFNTDRHHNAGELKIYYGRFGDEFDSLYIDTVPLGTAVSNTNVFALLEYGLPAIDAGEHTLLIQYVPSGEDTGHYIDFIAMHRDFAIPVRSSTWGFVKKMFESHQ